MHYLFLVLLVSNAMAAEKDPKAIVEEIFQRAGQELVATDHSVQSDINKYVDFEAMAKAVLAKSKSPAADFDWFKNTLKEIISLTVYPEAPSFLKNVSISYKAIEINGDSAVVHSLVKKKADVTAVDYKLQKQSQSEWRVVDISIEDESWVGTIREQVNSTIKKKNWQGLKTALNKRLEKLRRGKNT